MPSLVPAVLLAITDATGMLSAEQSVVTGIVSGGGYGLAVASVNGGVRLVSRGARAGLLLDATGRYGRTVVATPGAALPEDIAGSARTRFDVVTSPRTTLSFSADGLLASRLGLRAQNDLAVRDPFLQGRLIYTTGARLGLIATPTPLSIARFEAGYAQAGAVAADAPEAVGLDSHEAFATASILWAHDRSLRVGPTLRGGFTHFRNALLDVNLTRGVADVATASALATARWEASRTILATASLGVTVASPPTFLADASTVVAPEARIDARLSARRYGLIGTYGYAYTSLGPRIGFGMQHAASLELWARPREGREFRDVIARGIVRFRHGDAPLAATPPLGLPPGAPVREGSLVTTALAAGGSLGAPLGTGLMLTGAVDVELITARLEPDPTGASAPMFRTMVTLALSAIASTDPIRRLPRDPDARADDPVPAAVPEEARRAAPPGGPGGGGEDSEEEERWE